MPFKDKQKDKEYRKKYYRKNKDILSKKAKEYRKENLNRIKEVSKKYYENNKDKILKKQHERYKNDPKLRKKRLKRIKDWRERNKERVLLNQKKYYEKNKDKLSKYRIEYRQIIRTKALSIVSSNKVYCKNCRCNDIRLLEINHIDGNGKKDRKKYPHSIEFYQAIISGKRRIDDLDVLCRVCNVLYYVILKYKNNNYKIMYKNTKS